AAVVPMAVLPISRLGGGIWRVLGIFSLHPLAELPFAPVTAVANDESASGWTSHQLFPLPVRPGSVVGRTPTRLLGREGGRRCALLRALMSISRAVVGVGGCELARPIGFGVEEGFSAGGEGVAELGEGVDELLDAFSGRLGCPCGFASIACGQLLSGVEVAKTLGVAQL